MHDGVDPWVLEMNTLPGMTERSLVPKAALAAGLEMPELCAQLVDLVLRDAGQPPAARRRPQRRARGPEAEQGVA
jgi:D-alanine-D-alanine ligase